MTFYVCGGSNSVRKGGWLHHFPPETRNISIGAATSIMGVYRALFTQNIRAGDTLIWEYALNDSNQALGRGRSYTVDDLLGYCEVLIRHCADRGARFVALILTPRPRERQDKPDIYRRRLIRMLRHYDIPFVEVSRELRRKFEVPQLPDSDFFDDLHYAVDGRVVKYIARRTARICGADFVPVPTGRDPVVLASGQGVRLVSEFDGAPPPETFANKLVSLQVHPAAALPLTSAPLDHAGRVVGLFLVISPDSGVLELSVLGPDGAVRDRFDMAVSHAEPDFPKPVFKMFSLLNARAEPVRVAPGDRLRLAAATGAGEPLTDMGFASFPAAVAPPSALGIAGIMMADTADVTVSSPQPDPAGVG